MIVYPGDARPIPTLHDWPFFAVRVNYPESPDSSPVVANSATTAVGGTPEQTYNQRVLTTLTRTRGANYSEIPNSSTQGEQPMRPKGSAQFEGDVDKAVKEFVRNAQDRKTALEYVAEVLWLIADNHEKAAQAEVPA